MSEDREDEFDREMDEAVREWSRPRWEAVAAAVDFIDRVQQYARPTLRQGDAPGPMEKEANVVGALLRSRFARELESVAK